MLKMCEIDDTLSTIGQQITNDDLLLYILEGLGVEYDVVVVNLTSREDIVSLQKAQFLIQNHEIHIEQHVATSIHVQEASTNFVALKRGKFRGNHNRGSIGQGYYQSKN